MSFNIEFDSIVESVKLNMMKCDFTKFTINKNMKQSFETHPMVKQIWQYLPR